MVKLKYKIIGVIVLAILLFSLGVYYKDYTTKHENQIYENGRTQGTLETLSFIYRQALLCQFVPLTEGNNTVTLVAVECLKNN